MDFEEFPQQQQQFTQQDYDSLNYLISVFKRNPDKFNDRQVAALYKYAQAMGVPFEGRKDYLNATKNLLFELADTTAFGLIPDEWGPYSTSSLSDNARTLGGVLGFFTPGIGTLSVAGRMSKAAMGRLGKIATEGTEFFGRKLGAEAAETAVGKSKSLFDSILKPFKNVQKVSNNTEKAIAEATEQAAKEATEQIAEQAAKAGSKFSESLLNAAIKNERNFALADAALQSGAIAMTKSPVLQQMLKYGIAGGLDHYGERLDTSDPMSFAMSVPGAFLSGAVPAAVTGGIGYGVIGKTGNALINKLAGKIVEKIPGMSMIDAVKIANAYVAANIASGGYTEAPMSNVYF